MALDYKMMMQKALADGSDVMDAKAVQDALVLGRPISARERAYNKGKMAAARMPHKNPYDNLTPEQAAPQAVYAQDESSSLSQWKGVK